MQQCLILCYRKRAKGWKQKKIKKVGADMEGTRCLQDAYASVLCSGGPTWGRGGLRYSGHCKSGCEDMYLTIWTI